MNYIQDVLRPEAFIRIYAKVNNIPFNLAETEMRYRACYVGDISQENLDVGSLD